ncbi:phosphodiester glycosidase family protein [Flintibacter muris]|uniref:phosphodiester glycosidase family protein n=1 Tax=Flintibacter muris TaxID=2941327 RepID=UPI00203EA855|nr:phosphodiester glycosidase family protein [Flintibacter muris]
MRHTTSLPRRAAAFFLACLLLLPSVYATAGERKLQTTTEIVDGLVYRNTVTTNAGSRVESFSMELSPYSAARPILLQGSGTIYAGATINKVISNAQEAGYHVLGAINTDFFSMATGVPIGIVIEDGVYKSGTDGENAMAIVNNAVSIVDAPQVSMSLYDHATGVTVVPNSFNKARHPVGGVYLLNEAFSTVSTRSDGSGWYVRLRAIPDPYTGQVPDLTVNSTLSLEVTELLLSDQSIIIGPDEYILTASDDSGREDAYAAFQVGDLVTLTTSCTDPALSAAQWAGGVGDIMVRNGAITDSSTWVYAKDGRQPRSAMGIKPDGTVVLYAVDGRQSGYSVGLTQLNLAEELLSQGCTTAVNLDGGGSTSLSMWIPGTNGPVMQNKSSDGRARSCATYLLLVASQPSSYIPQRLAPKENGQVVFTGSSLTLPQAAAMDEVLNPVSADLSGLTYTSMDRLGSVLNGVYTAGWQTGTDNLLLTAGNLEGYSQVHVVNQLTEFTVSRSGSTAALTSLSVKPGQQVQLAASGTYWGRTALRDFAPVTVTVQGGVGTVDSNGLFTASQDLSGGGSITFTAGGLSQTVQVSSVYVHNDVQPGHWAYDAVEYCYEKGVCSGISSTLFGPDNSMIRGDFMLMLYNAAGKPAVNTPCTFTDVAETDYYYTALAWGQSNGLASGTGNGKFSPRDQITREQAFSLLYRYLPIISKNCPDGDPSVLDQFADHSKIAAYAQTAAATLVSQGLASGSAGNLDPQGTLTRAQMASLLYRVLEHTPIQTQPTNPSTPTDPVTPAQPGNYAIALDQSQVTLASGSSVTLNAVVLPATEGAAVTWTSSSPDTAVVSSTGMVTNLYSGNGEAKVTITASWNGASASCTVTCQQAQRTGTVTNAEYGLNIRSGPGTNYNPVGGLANGTSIVILSEQPGWYQILFRNDQGQAAIGYVSADYITLNR